MNAFYAIKFIICFLKKLNIIKYKELKWRKECMYINLSHNKCYHCLDMTCHKEWKRTDSGTVNDGLKGRERNEIRELYIFIEL